RTSGRLSATEWILRQAHRKAIYRARGASHRDRWGTRSAKTASAFAARRLHGQCVRVLDATALRSLPTVFTDAIRRPAMKRSVGSLTRARRGTHYREVAFVSMATMTDAGQDSTTANTTRIRDTALIFEGGGMRASLTSGMVVTLLDAGLDFDWVAGISAGASNAVNYLSDDARRARRSFVEFAADEQFGGLRSFARGQGMFNAEYVYQKAGGPNEALPFEWETFGSSPSQLRVIAFDAESGDEVVWSRKDTPRIDDVMIRVRASSTMPGLMPPVHLNGHVYVDGAMGEDGGIALSQAQREGFEKFVI